MPTDEQIEAQIQKLDAERDQLWRQESDDPGHEHHANRLEQVRVDLDQCWDLLRQRRALREAGEDPEQASARATEIVEKYWQ